MDFLGKKMWLFTYGTDAENVLSQTERDGLDSPCGKKKSSGL